MTTARRTLSAPLNPASAQVVPGIYRTVLPNGVRIISEDVPGARSFALGIWIDIGTRDEQEDIAGISHFIEHAVFRRSSTRSSGQIAAQFESLGAYINAFTSKEQTCYYVRALSPHFTRCLDLLSDVVLHPLFRAKDVEKERTVILEELKSYEDEAEEFIQDCAEKALFGSHPLGFPIAGTQQSVARLKVKDLQAFHARYYVPQNIVIAVAGNIQHDVLVEQVRKLFRAASAKGVIAARSKARVVKTKRVELERPFSQSHLLLVRRTSGVRHAERWALSMLNTILGDGMSSRLHQRIRERQGVAYALYSSLQLLTDCGVLAIYAGTEHSKLSKTEDLVARELQLLAQKGVKNVELRRAKEQVKSSIIMGLESMSARMNSLAKAELEELHIEDVNDSLAAIDAVTLSEINAVCAAVCDPSTWTRVIIRGTSETSTGTDSSENL